MIRSVVFSNPQNTVLISRCSRRTIDKIVQRRLFANGSDRVGSNSLDDLNNEDRQELLKTLLMNDELRHTMVYSLAMGSLDGSRFPPLMRSLNDREKEQLRISKIQQRQFRSNSAVAVASGEKEQQRSITNGEQRREDRKSLFRAIGQDEEIHNSMAYSLAMAMDLDEANFLPLTLSPKNTKEKEDPSVSRDQNRRDRMVANEQIYGDHKINDDGTPLMVADDIDLDVNDYDDFDDDTLSMAYSPSLASSLNNGYVEFPSLTRSLNKRESEQLRISKSQLIPKCTTYPEQRRRKHPLPRTLQDALLPSSEAIVITENRMPFRVFNVNTAWEGLCGYSSVESKGKSLGTLLGGEETDTCAVTALIHQLFVHGEEATTVLTNYTKDGRKFRNRLSVGPLYDEETNEVSHFVGVLKEVSVAA